MSHTDTKRVIALGFFDGVHVGHGALLSLCAKRAAELGAVPAAFTFDVHPSALILHDQVPLLSTPADRAGLMERYYGIREVIVAHYGEAMMRMPWRDFVTRFLVKEHGAVHVVAGHDFHFGYKGEGNPQRLTELCAELGVGCDIVPKVELDGVTVSSTHIRNLIAQGEMAEAVRFLGHPHVLTGTVLHGKGLGGRLGFPTANLTFPAGLLIPAHGVYATKIWVLPDYPDNHEPLGPQHLPGEGPYPAVTNVGVRPTVEDERTLKAEPYILDGFHGDLYGRTVRLEFFHYLRPERKFDSLDDLRAEVLRNAQQTLDFFAETTR